MDNEVRRAALSSSSYQYGIGGMICDGGGSVARYAWGDGGVVLDGNGMGGDLGTRRNSETV